MLEDCLGRGCLLHVRVAGGGLGATREAQPRGSGQPRAPSCPPRLTHADQPPPGRFHGGQHHLVESAHIASQRPYILLSTDALSNICVSAHAMPQTDSVFKSFSMPCCVVQPLSTRCLIFSVPASSIVSVWLACSRSMLCRGQLRFRPGGTSTTVLADIQNPILPFVSVA